jgi:predicted nucleotidyltransferase
MSYVSQVDPRLEAVKAFWPEFHVKRAWVFGSRARKEGSTNSDWDFLVDFDSKPGFGSFMGLKCRLEDALQAKVDLLSLSACKKSFLNAIKNDLVDVS